MKRVKLTNKKALVAFKVQGDFKHLESLINLLNNKKGIERVSKTPRLFPKHKRTDVSVREASIDVHCLREKLESIENLLKLNFRSRAIVRTLELPRFSKKKSIFIAM